jgi:hypothetical protein
LRRRATERPKYAIQGGTVWLLHRGEAPQVIAAAKLGLAVDAGERLVKVCLKKKDTKRGPGRCCQGSFYRAGKF